MKRMLIAVLLTAATVTGCGGSSGSGTTSWQSKLGCTSVTEEGTEELFALNLYTCTKSDGKQTSVYTFQTSQARDHWREIAEQVGGVVLNSGSTWLETKQ